LFDRQFKEFAVATSKKKASKKSKAKKARKAAPARAGKKAPTKKRAAKSKRGVKKSGKTVKRVAKKASGKVAKKAPRKTGKKAAKKIAKKAVKRTVAKKTVAKKAVAAPKKARTVDRTSSAEKSPKTVAPRAVAPRVVKAAPVPKPAPAAERNTYFITTAIAYPNGQPHIGHAYEVIATDALARFQRLDGKDVFFLTGTDEHGQKMIQTAAAEGMTPSDLATRNAGRFKEMDERLNVSFDRFIRTSEPAHHRSVQVIWNRMQQNGDIYIDVYSGWYSVRDEAYYAEEETVVGEDNVRRGPQGSPVEWVEEKSYFFRLSAYQDKLLALYNDQPDFIGPDSRRNEVMSFVKGGLKDLSISRTTFDWGVKVPDRKSVV
jgi:methionyl-tRNA synthetase